ncbi:MAG: GatB/YqeY domain-containing protein [Rhodospirillales bacterium]|nr:GatB/YqeY domain-containing protein [Rhodospirillales bacterium]MCB9996038.1 GatB/YqeY domain-containing protein [Rhodospirillales bacterium]
MDKRTEFNNALKEALKSKDQVAMGTIRLIIAALKDRDIEARGKGNAEGIGESEILSLLQSMVKQRQESCKIYKDAGRDDLADREAAEIEVIQRFLPQQMSEDEVQATVEGLISELGVSDIKEMGKVMAELKTRYAGQLDMARASGVVKERLAS